MCGEQRIVVYDDSRADTSHLDSCAWKVMCSLAAMGLTSLLSYWLIIEAQTVWQKPFDHTGYTLWITSALIVVHAGILLAVLWLSLAMLGLVLIIAEFLWSVLLPFRLLCLVVRALASSLWHFTRRAVFKNKVG